MEFEEFRNGCPDRDGDRCKKVYHFPHGLSSDATYTDSCVKEVCDLWYLKKCMSAEIKASMPVNVAEMLYPDKDEPKKAEFTIERPKEIMGTVYTASDDFTFKEGDTLSIKSMGFYTRWVRESRVADADRRIHELEATIYTAIKLLEWQGAPHSFVVKACQTLKDAI